ncbi:MAG: ATP-grasp domain-containing protein [Sphingobacteriales bacterium]|nr:ATP-grasp domain-containing protein [Sphingobacteriales bacterium]
MPFTAEYVLGSVNGFHHPPQGSVEEIALFHQLQKRFTKEYENSFPDKLAAKTVVIIPSLTLDQEILSKINGVLHYEERLLCLLMLLRMPRTQIIYITSVPIDPVIIDYYLHLLPGITGYHARQRLILLSCFDASHKSLTEKILASPRLMQRIRMYIPEGNICHLACFNVTEHERSLAVRLNMPLYGCDPDLYFSGTKSGSRKIFKECNIPVPPGYENLKNEEEVINALVELKINYPWVKKAVVKMNDGFSGEGNGVFHYDGAPANDDLRRWINAMFKKTFRIVADELSYEKYFYKFQNMGGIVEAFIEGEIINSPSVQCRVNPLGMVDVISTHDQELGGESGQVFMGASFPANKDYAVEIGEMGKRVAEVLKHYGVIGRFGIDFISVKENDRWKHYAIEINLRKGGTTHPYLMLQFLTDGNYDSATGIYKTANGQTRYYYATDNLKNDVYKGLTPHDLIDIAMYNGLMYDGSSQEGVMFHLIGAMSQYGKIGLVCIGSSPQRAYALYERTVDVLLKEALQ